MQMLSQKSKNKSTLNEKVQEATLLQQDKENYRKIK